MSGIDPHTLVIVVSFQALLMALVLTAMRLSFPKAVDGIGLWAASMPFFVLASLVFSQQQTHPIVHVILANFVFCSGLLFAIAGMRRFYSLKLPRISKVGAYFSLVFVVLAWFTFVQPSFQFRLVFMSMLGAALFGHLAWLPLRHSKRGIGRVITSVAFGWTAFSCVLRALSVVWNLDQPSELLDLSILQAIYLTSFNISLLLGSIGFILLINERLRFMLEYRASHDALTGVLNRGAFFKQAETVFDRSRRLSQPLSVALLDLDHFKQINDEHGHAIGDYILQEFCRAAQEVLRPSDVLGRYGGEEFVMLLPDTSEEDAIAVIENLHNIVRSDSAQLPYTVSVGVASLDQRSHSIDELLIKADKALYKAKRNGRNRVEKWMPNPTPSSNQSSTPSPAPLRA